MSLLHTFYPQHLLPTGEQCPVCADPINLVVCLPPVAGRHLLALAGDLVDRLRLHVAAAAGLLDTRHFMLWRRPDPTEARLLVLPAPDPQHPGLTWCAGGPVGLLDLATTAHRLRECAPPATKAGERFTPDMYGPGLEALHTGDPGVYADYQAGLLTFGDGLLTLDGQLLIPSFSPVLVEQTLAERQVFHDRARNYVAALDPTTLLVAVTCLP